MCSRTIASVVSLLFLCPSAFASEESFALTIEYPVEHYRIEQPDPLRDVRTVEARFLLESLGMRRLAETSRSGGGASLATDLRLQRVVRPIRVLWNDPRFLVRPPVIVEWIELVDERGLVTRVWVLASNQSKRDDERIIGWCTSTSLRSASEREEHSVGLQTAGVTLVGSPYHYSSIPGALRTTKGKVVGLAVLAFAFWMAARVIRFRREERLRHERLMTRLHRTTPYKPPSFHDEP